MSRVLLNLPAREVTPAVPETSKSGRLAWGHGKLRERSEVRLPMDSDEQASPLWRHVYEQLTKKTGEKIVDDDYVHTLTVAPRSFTLASNEITLPSFHISRVTVSPG